VRVREREPEREKEREKERERERERDLSQFSRMGQMDRKGTIFAFKYFFPDLWKNLNMDKRFLAHPSNP
jgi:hypothetical protein